MAEPKEPLNYSTFLTDFKNVLTSYNGYSHKNLCTGILRWLDERHYIPYAQSEAGQPQAEALVSLFILAHGLLRYLIHDRHSEKLKISIIHYLEDSKKKLPLELNKFIISRFLKEQRSLLNDLYDGSEAEHYSDIEKFMDEKVEKARIQIKNIANTKQISPTADLPVSSPPDYVYTVPVPNPLNISIFIDTHQYQKAFPPDTPLSSKLLYSTCVNTFVATLRKYSPDKKAQHSQACDKLIIEISQNLSSCHGQQDRQLLKFLRIVFALWNYLKNYRHSKHLFPLVDGYLRDLLPYVPRSISTQLEYKQPNNQKSKEEGYISATFSGTNAQMLFSPLPDQAILPPALYSKFFDDRFLPILQNDLKIQLTQCVAQFLEHIKNKSANLSDRRKALANLMYAENMLKKWNPNITKIEIERQITLTADEQKCYQSLENQDLSEGDLSELHFNHFSFLKTNLNQTCMNFSVFFRCNFTSAMTEEIAQAEEVEFIDCINPPELNTQSNTLHRGR